MNSTEINYTLESAGSVTLVVTDANGKVVFNQDLGYQSVGANRYRLDVSSLQAGNYQYTIVTETGKASKSMTVVK
jgi:flagellar hook assembly protein FlgD